VIGIYMTDESALWSLDKDLKQIPGLHWVDDDWELVTHEEADRFFLYQVLVGDPADGYGGCSGIGPVRANRILDNDCSWEAVVRAYESKGLTEADAVLTAQQARILRSDEYDFDNMEPILWTPT
jgi:5''-3'' exonuclease (including N-terminal domain of PolI)